MCRRTPRQGTTTPAKGHLDRFFLERPFRGSRTVGTPECCTIPVITRAAGDRVLTGAKVENRCDRRCAASARRSPRATLPRACARRRRRCRHAASSRSRDAASRTRRAWRVSAAPRAPRPPLEWAPAFRAIASRRGRRRPSRPVSLVRSSSRPLASPPDFSRATRASSRAPPRARRGPRRLRPRRLWPRRLPPRRLPPRRLRLPRRPLPSTATFGARTSPAPAFAARRA